jgi:hypothetical protein
MGSHDQLEAVVSVFLSQVMTSRDSVPGQGARIQVIVGSRFGSGNQDLVSVRLWYQRATNLDGPYKHPMYLIAISLVGRDISGLVQCQVSASHVPRLSGSDANTGQGFRLSRTIFRWVLTINIACPSKPIDRLFPLTEAEKRISPRY